MRNTPLHEKDYHRIEKSLLYLREHLQNQPRLEDLSRQVRLSPWHFQRLFKRWAGISPKTYLAYLTAHYAKGQLAESRSVLDAAYDSGLSSPGRLHDLMVTVEAMTPGEYKKGGAGLAINYGIHPTPFGEALLGLTSRGVCHLAFLAGQNKVAALKVMKNQWPRADFREDISLTRKTMRAIFGRSGKKLRVLLKGSPFQLKVWEALLKIPTGKKTTYRMLARGIDFPRSARAVGAALGANSVAFLIPCHRVIRETGALGGYRWGLSRKTAILTWESCKRLRETKR
jgi:AraC family transcriptional regulator of adaptative response/methylated-DNA-[protein]-cysteine methyltransferase